MRVLGLSLVLLLSSCECSNGVRPGCSSSRDCDADEICLDRRCVADPATDGGAIDAARADAQPVDAPPTDAVCGAVEAAAHEILRPIDAIILPDESASMGPARDSVALAMETTFRTTMETAGIDYHVIWIGVTPLPMLEATGRLTRDPISIGSGSVAMFKPVLDTYATWRPAIRDDAIHVFIHFTDATSGDGSTIAGYTGMFDEVLTTMEPALWGTPGAYDFVYHAFVGMPANSPMDLPYPPGDRVQTTTCDPRFYPAIALQEMAIRTGGLRFPLCYPELFDSVFRRIAESAIDRASIGCELALPTPPAGMTIDLATLAVRYTDGSGGSNVLFRAATAAECTDSGFVLEADRVVLCPAACARVEADPGAILSVLTGCDPTLY